MAETQTTDVPSTPDTSATSATAEVQGVTTTKNAPVKEALEAGQKNANLKGAPPPTVTKDQIKASDVSEISAEDLNKMVKMKVRGQEKLMPLKEAIARAQKADGAELAMQEKAQYEKALKKVEHLLANDPAELLRMAGHDPEKWSEERLRRKLEEMQMSPEQKEIAELKRYKAEAEKSREELAKEAESSKRAAAETQMAQAIDNELTEAFAASGLPKRKFYVQQVAAEVRAANMRGEDLTFREAVETIKERFFGDLGDAFDHQDIANVLEKLGPERAKKIREHFVKQLTQVQTTDPKRSGPSNTESREKRNVKSITEREWRQIKRGIV